MSLQADFQIYISHFKLLVANIELLNSKDSGQKNQKIKNRKIMFYHLAFSSWLESLNVSETVNTFE